MTKRRKAWSPPLSRWKGWSPVSDALPRNFSTRRNRSSRVPRWVCLRSTMPSATANSGSTLSISDEYSPTQKVVVS